MLSRASLPIRARLRILGAVQGVGFRPCVFRLATELELTGWVNNSAQGVTVEVEGERTRVEKFILRLEAEKPPLSFIQRLETSWLAAAGYNEFTIRESDSGGAKTALVLPDIATCPDCMAEIFDPANRRHLYPFTNCTNCGPRFTIIEALPYDRPSTSMRDFAMCAECRREYEDPRDRRFHAQPNACPVCGPHLELWEGQGKVLYSRHPALAAAADAIRSGEIVAVKGIGGFHLMADARNDTAVRRLRERKHRDEKPFAVMAPSLRSVRDECDVSDFEERLLRSVEAPIVLLRRRQEAVPCESVAPSVAPGNPSLGIMLPYSPLHHLLLAELGFPVVATSGNLSDEPICTEEGEALERLGGIAKFFLVHNRRILRHVDDSIVRVVLGRELVLRRSRGYAPLPVRLKSPGPPVLATGAHLKSAVALSTGDTVFISQHIGDLETGPALEAFERVIGDLQRLYEIRPAAVAMDAHPDYLSTQFATRFSKASSCGALPVQHHIAHVLSCMAENEIEGSALGVAWDGTGYGLDGTIWGGEFFKAGAGPDLERVAHLRTFALPGGQAAVREPRRCALGVLYEIFGEAAFEMDIPPIRAFSDAELVALRTVLRRALNSPRTSSAGRLFDAVVSLAGIRHTTSFEGQAAMALEFAADGCEARDSYPFELAGPVVDWEPMIRGIVADAQAMAKPGLISAKFHCTLAHIIVAVARRTQEAQVVLSGGCFQNERLLRLAVGGLREAGMEPAWHRRVPPNDGGIALGQVAAFWRARGIPKGGARAQ